MKSRLALVVFCLATWGFSKYPEITGSLLDTPMKNQAPGTAPDICSWIPRDIFLADRATAAELPEPWTDKQLMAPADLAAIINDPNVKKPIIICVGPGALIRGSLDIGPAKEKANLEKLKQQLNKLPKDANVVIYCGCCPFEHCPNIRPAFMLLNEMKFSNARLLNLEHNINTDWIAKGYPKA
jgi:thiosulfate/3-mercaptopyruvate sulfurtransferase